MMKRSTRLAAAAAALAALTALVTGCSSESSSSATTSAVSPPPKLVSSGKLTYGVAATFPPFEYQQGGKDTGFDVEMGAELAKYMGLTPSPVDLDFNGLIPALGGNRLDIINSAMYINDQRSKQVDFIPYMEVGEALLVPKADKGKITKVPDDLSGKTVAVTQGAIGETYMTAFNKQLKSEGKAQMKILSLPTNQDALLAVKSGRAATFDTSTPGAAYTVSQEKGALAVTATFKIGTKIGIAVRKGDSDTKKAIEAALDKFVSSGDYAKLMKKYNLPASSGILTAK